MTGNRVDCELIDVKLKSIENGIHIIRELTEESIVFETPTVTSVISLKIIDQISFANGDGRKPDAHY